MILRLSSLLRRRKNERGVETVAMIIVLPTLFVLLISIVEMGFYMRTRMLVENEARDTVRRAASDGGNYWDLTNETGIPWDDQAFDDMYNEHSRKCIFSACDRPPTVDCKTVDLLFGARLTNQNVVQREGDMITCTIQYHYHPLAAALLNGPLGLGTGGLIRKDFTVAASARAETGPNSYAP